MVVGSFIAGLKGIKRARDIRNNGQEARLSNLIQQVPELQNPVTEFLAHDADEGEIEGRLKNVLEGLGLEMAVGSFIAGLKGIKRARDVRNNGGTPEEAAAAVDEVLQGGTALAFSPEKGFPLPPTNLPSLEPQQFGRALSQEADLDRVGGVWESMSETENLFRRPVATLASKATKIQDVLTAWIVTGKLLRF